MSAPPDPPTARDYLVGTVRTVVPAAWAAGLAWAVNRGLPADLAAPLEQADDYVLVPVCVAGVYAGARWLEARTWVPRWLVRVLLGSARQPVYPPS